MDGDTVQIKNMPSEFEKALPILRKIEAAGYEAYFVGGSVRDTILQRPIHDVDIATSAYPSEVKSLFKRTADTGIEHGTVMILDHGTGYEVTTFRTESGYQDYRRPDKVTFVRSLKEDLKRRDFTINALALSENGKITDLFGGLNDMSKKIIRAVGDPEERFNEDALRMMRAVRFASQLDFKIEQQTLTGIYDHSELLKKIAVERIHSEFVKMMLGVDAKNGLNLMIKSQLYQFVPDFSEHLTVLQKIVATHFDLDNEVQVWALFTSMFQFNRDQVISFLKRWKTANKIINDVILTTELIFQIKSHKVGNLELYKAGKQNVQNAVAIISNYTDFDSAKLIKAYDQLPITTKKQLNVTGGDLIKRGILNPGPKLGETLEALEKAVILGKINNQDSELIAAAMALNKE
ncbi:CCA tRNA nucleotidyltransferase [Lentilactobacillus hilgardii]|uniref:CCA-adding enzyme n=1 Tax=Lentilactobacillus hilgardii (strain ATCC 8290 / DSM 20176 / CCUG 30140 / JCM 1155 / KCTC 3500 / NBRC 15886 / NCIMB 8040 / NRRL B-1843 / 9) TaxID=1423757 RepID=C0XLT2_LENH9|nr:CCA tRNA nucleotidyltransferase [Lentilactobacillus hilgardii]EEI18511.1 tRNA nucleotidyltransferase/poly(A) polymerase family protein [Lentilactobacillus buchneri ATCC 11577]EEI23652.1 tRNA nucleotidyltransferase/poly(A) polymerase family protein [Lentilactobacillus hilgardii DSM 20176 = ATCC 8290]KRK56490.1 tRNA nucleotidyltransferase poly(A) polymerase [Lentilactobacillus hilgardii DSM 20176 = ATCC 8290]MCP9332210.1 CCA tRNA nucleotidyltransferase [Lentilactobacillus hilgardii]MCP9348840